MKIQLGDYIINANIEGDQLFFSKHTGAPLRRVNISFRAKGEDTHEEIQRLLEETGEVVSLNENDEPDGQWKAIQRSFSYQQGRPYYDYQWELEGKEELKIEEIVLGDVAFKPYLYKEKFDYDDLLIIKARVSLTLEEFGRLKALFLGEQYFQVIRKGISNESREMRFGKALWSEQDDTVKFQIYLVDRAKDEDGKLGIFQPEMRNIQSMLARTTECFLELLSVLVEKEVLTSEEQDRIKTVSQERMLNRVLKFDQVDDLDELPLD